MSWDTVEAYRKQAATLREQTFNPEAFFRLQEIEAAITILINKLTKS
jgi:hypothetical protein